MSIAWAKRPIVGEIRTGIKCGYADTGSYIWHACPDCGKERWVQLRGTELNNRRCASCAQMRDRNARWNDGLYKNAQGYMFVRKRNHPYSNCDGRVKRARLVLEEKLGRHLLKGMEIHHINSVRDDDRPKNLMEIGVSEHRRLPRKRRVNV